MTKNSGSAITILTIAGLCIAIGLAGGIALQNGQIIKQPKKPVVSASPTKKPTISASPTATPSSQVLLESKTQPSGLIALHIDAIDYSEGHPAGLVPTAKVKLFDANNNFIKETLPTPHIQNGPVGTGGDAVFYVLPGTYNIEADAGNMSGTCNVTVRTTTEFNSCAIYMVSKKVHINGKYFDDSNNNGQQDGGEGVMGGKTIYFIFTNNQGQTYSAGQTKTDSQGNYSIDLPYTGTFYAYADYEGGNGQPRSSSVKLNGGESATLNVTKH